MLFCVFFSNFSKTMAVSLTFTLPPSSIFSYFKEVSTLESSKTNTTTADLWVQVWLRLPRKHPLTKLLVAYTPHLNTTRSELCIQKIRKKNLIKLALHFSSILCFGLQLILLVIVDIAVTLWEFPELFFLHCGCTKNYFYWPITIIPS